MKLKSYISASLVVLTTSLTATSQTLTIDDYCNLKVNQPSAVKDIVPMPDGTSYAAVSKDGNKIEAFSFKTGKKTEDLFNVNSIKGDVKIDNFDGFSISDNGKKILLWNNMEKIYRNSFYADYYVYDIMRQSLAKVSDNGSQRAAVMSHDGRCVAFVRGNNIFISNLDYKTEVTVTEDGIVNSIINGCPDWSYEEEFGYQTAMRWSSDDNVLAFIKFNETDVPVYNFNQYESYCEGNPLNNPYPAVYSYKYPLAGYPVSKVSVHAYNLDNRQIKNMDIPLKDDDYIPAFEFDGEGKNIMVMVLNREQNNLSLYKVNPGSTVSTMIYGEKSDTWLSHLTYQMVKFEKNNFVVANETSGYRHLYSYDYNGNLKKQITKGDFNVTAYYGTDVQGNSFMQTTASGAINRDIAYVDNSGKYNTLNGNPGTSSAIFSKDMSHYLLNFSSAETPNQYFLYTSKGKKVADLELNSSYASRYSSAPKMEFLKVKNDAGEEMNAYMIKPSGFDSSKRYPLLMYQYNGPDSQEVLNKWRMEGIFYLASQGYVVACVDGRGTANRSASWAKCVYGNLGDLETKDQIVGANYFVSLPFVDASKVACFGWSYGGYMTLKEMEASNSPFKAGVAMAPVADWRFYDAVYTERFMKTPSQNPSGYDRSSALLSTSTFKGKLLIMSGSNDDNVHPYNTLAFASKLSFEGGIPDMMIYSGFEHSLRMCDARVQLFKKIADFLNLNMNKAL